MGALCSVRADAGSTPAPSPPLAHFARLPTKRVLTLNMDVPERWLVEAIEVGERTPAVCDEVEVEVAV